MDLDRIFRGMTVSGSGMLAERKRLDVIAQNIANANSLAGPDGGPYRRRNVVFETIMADARGGAEVAGGVRVGEVAVDMETPLREVHDKNHPLADDRGVVSYPNVNMAFEMVDLMTAARAYEANLKAVGVYRDMMRQALRLMEG